MCHEGAWRGWLPVAAVAGVLALAFLGARPVWDPDEGRYTNVALEILHSGDWIDLARNDETGHWTKPPLTYQAIAVSLAGLGRSAWAARLPSALAYLLTAWLVARCARRLAPGAEKEAALVYATMLLPFAGSQFVSTDALLTALETLGVCGFIELRFGNGTRVPLWITCLAAGFGLAFMTKGPPTGVTLIPTTSPRSKNCFQASVGSPASVSSIMPSSIIRRIGSA